MYESIKTSPLRTALDPLMVAWRSTNGAHILPWLMAQSLRSFAESEPDGALRFREIYFTAVVEGLVNKVEAAMQSTLDADQRKLLKSAVIQIEEEAQRS